MKIHLKKTHIQTSPEQEAYINKKINELDKYIQHPNNDLEVWVNVGRPSEHHKHGNSLNLTVDIHVPGRTLRAEASGEDIFGLVNEVYDELQREIRKYKEKTRTKQRKSFRLFKIFKNKDKE